MIASVATIKSFQEDLKPLKGILKSQVGLVVAVDQGKKSFVDSKLSHGRGGRYSTRGSNRMLVVYVLLYKL